MDGVIIDSEPIHCQVNMKIFKELNIEVSLEEYNNFIGSTNMHMWATLVKKHNINQSKEAMCTLTAERNLQYVKEEAIEPIAGIPEFLQELKNNNILIGLASSSPLDNIELVLSKLGIINFFNAIVSGENVSKPKPAPDIFLKAAEKLKVSPKNCVVIEDSTHGVAAAKAAGMKCLGFNNINSGNQNFSQADKIVDTITSVDLSLCTSMFK
jgi:beta-phosphoglucomutase family hydrolase